MKTFALLMLIVAILAVLCYFAAPAQAAGIDLSKFTVVPSVWVPINPDRGDTTVTAGIQWTPMPNATAPLCPTNWDEIWPWAKASFFIVAPLDITGDGRGKLAGLGAGEAVTVGSLFDAPAQVSPGFEKHAKWSVGLSLNVASWLGW
jgi:hypothetical protein